MHDSLPTAHEIARAVASGGIRATDLAERSLRVIAARDPEINAFLEVTAEHALSRAAAIDAGDAGGALAGVPVAVKDNICTTFSRTTCGSKILANYRSAFDATVIRRIEAAGGVIVGKTNCDEFAMGSSTENSAFVKTRNPIDPSRVPGGSSGGSAAAVASGMVPLALGSDTGGSVRQPAAFCGIVGLKPTYGRVSRLGLIAYGSSLDQIGPMAGNVTDTALLFGVISGHDPADATSASVVVDDCLAALSDDPLALRRKNLRIGVPREYFGEGLDAEVRAAIEAALATYRHLGATVVDVSLPHTRHGIAAYYVIATAECSSNLARFDGVHYGHRSGAAEGVLELYSRSRAEGFGPEVKRRLMLGTFALSAGYHDAFFEKALRVRRLLHDDFVRAFQSVDILACPTTPTPAFRLGAKSADPLQMYLEDVYTISANLAGIPAISLPCGVSAGGLPIGLQLMGPHFGELPLFQAARLFEREAEPHRLLSQRRST